MSNVPAKHPFKEIPDMRFKCIFTVQYDTQPYLT